MITERTQLLTTTIQKLLHRGAMANIQRILSKTHSADIAAVLQGFTEEEAFSIFQLEPTAQTRAQILSYLDNDLQKNILDRLSSDEASELVNLMDSDDAADLLAQLPAEESKDILEGLEHEDSTEVVDLMTYPEDSAGGIMSSDYAEFTEDMTVEHVIQALQSEEMENKIMFYIYVLNSTGHLVGVVSLKQVLLSKKTMMLKQLMHPSVITVRVDTDQEQVAKTVERYDFLSIPVIDGNNKLVGVITVDDVIDVIREEAASDLLAMGQAGRDMDMTLIEHFRARLPWQLATYLTGVVCFTLVTWFGRRLTGEAVPADIWSMMAFLPLTLILGSMAGNQSSTVMVGALQTGRYIGGRMRAHIGREFLLAAVFSVLFGVATFSLLHMFSIAAQPTRWALVIAAQITCTIVLGATLPHLLHKLKLDITAVTVPVVTAAAHISAVLILFGLS